ncbi:hypothetical protein A176_006781 [Myxococcus hansupus]|uniref:TraB/GumN family protein n=2 Tax=Pseudomyxococcus hansupus TaxID=1297742 RepID=A0A0H4X3U5_9BACT|nr:hypothetical protein A176_006781 [Myxococcus hansupus]
MHAMKSSSLLTSLLLSTWLGLGCASTPAPTPDAAAPTDTGLAFLWEVTDSKGGLAYLVGSVHLGKEGTLPLTPSMETAFEKSDVLVVEVDVGKVDTADMQRLLRGLGLLPKGQRLTDRLEPETMMLLGSTAERLGLELRNLERLRPWLVGLTIGVMEFQRAGYQQGHGVDRAFLDRARGVQMDIVELETAESQLRLLAETPEPLQDLMLRDQLRRERPVAEVLELLIGTWKAGDAERLAQLLLEGAEDPTYRPVYERIFFERNQQMARSMEAMLAEPRTHFVVVGAGHVVGPGGIVDLLQKRGFTARQLPRDVSR